MEWHGGQIKCALPSRGVSLADVFSKIEGQKTQLQIGDYAISQTSLEQVFLSFAKLQEGDEHVVADEIDTEKNSKKAKALNSNEGVTTDSADGSEKTPFEVNEF